MSREKNQAVFERLKTHAGIFCVGVLVASSAWAQDGADVPSGMDPAYVESMTRFTPFMYSEEALLALKAYFERVRDRRVPGCEDDVIIQFVPNQNGGNAIMVGDGEADFPEGAMRPVSAQWGQPFLVNYCGQIFREPVYSYVQDGGPIRSNGTRHSGIPLTVVSMQPPMQLSPFYPGAQRIMSPEEARREEQLQMDRRVAQEQLDEIRRARRVSRAGAAARRGPEQETVEPEPTSNQETEEEPQEQYDLYADEEYDPTD